MSIRSGIMSQSRPAGRTAPPGQISSGTSGIGGSSLRTPGPTAASAAAKISPKTPTTTTTTPTPTVGNAQSGTGNKLQQSQAPAVQQQQQPQQQQQTQQPAKVQASPSAAQQPPPKQDLQQQQQQQPRPAPKTQINPPSTSQPTPTKPPTTQAQQPPPPSAASKAKAPTTDPKTSAVPDPQQPQPVQAVQATPTRPPLPTIALVLDPPSELAFRGSFKHTLTTCMRLTNPSPDTRVCYKLRTTAPHLYCAKPSVDVIGPNQTADVKVILQAASVDHADINVRHKLMVQWISVPEGQITGHDKLWQQSRPQEVSSAKLSCVLERIPEKTVESRPFVENGVESVSTRTSYSATNSKPITETTSSSTSKSPSSSSSSGILLVLLVVVVAVIAALLYNNKQ